MVDCNDTLEFKNTSNLINSNGFVYSPTIQIYQLDSLQANFDKVAVFTPFIDPFITAYSQTVFDQSLISFNNFLFAAAYTNTYLNLQTNYPFVNDRISTGVAITPIEFSVFMTDCGYNPVTIQDQQILFPTTVLSLYNSHINGKFSKSTMGAFCALAPTIFGAVAGFFTAVKTIAKKITDIINFIQNFSLAALVDQLKKKITDVIEKTIAKVKQIIENFTLKGLITQAQQFFHEKIMHKFKELKDQAMAFFDEFNLENFKNRIDGLISYATGLFKDPNLEEIQFLIYRFCSFITQVENIINGVKNPLQAFTNSYASATQLLQARSGLNTASVIAAGGSRFTNDEVYSTVTNGITSETAAGNAPPSLTGDIEGVTPWNEGKGDSRVTFAEGALRDGRESWDRVTGNVKVRLMKLQQKFGIQLRIISAYRSTEKQAALYAADLAANGGVKSGNVAPPGSSLHETGNALDIKFSGLNSQSGSQFIQMARSEGFGGAKNYGSFIHIDVGAVRTW